MTVTSASSCEAKPDSETNEPAYFRQVQGKVTSFGRKEARSVRFESNRLDASEPVVWRFRQPAAALFWWDTGFRRYDLDVDGGVTHADQACRRPLGLIPPEAEVRGEHHIGPNCVYHVLFIEHALLEDHGKRLLDEPLIGFSDRGLENSIAELQRWRDDASFSLMAEGWALQAIARMRQQSHGVEQRSVATGGLSGFAFRQIEEFVMSRLHETISITELAQLAGLSVRHFSRAFLAHTRMTPARFVHERRVELARELLLRPELSMTEVALACGFSHSQHFTTSFKRATAMTPSEYRGRSLR